MNSFLKNELYNLILYLIGSIILIWLGVNAFRLKKEEIKKSYKKKMSNNNSFFVGFIIAMANPIVIAFWLSLSSSYFMQFGSKNLVFLNIFLVAFGFNLVHIPLAGIIHKTRHKIPSKYVLLLSKIFGIILLLYGCSFLFKFFRLIFN